MASTALLVADRLVAERWLAARCDEGRRERDLRELPSVPWDLTDRGWAAWTEPVDVAGVARALEAVVRGVAVAIVVPADRDVAELLVDDLRRLVAAPPADGAVPASGPSLPAPVPAGDPGPPELAAELDPETLELLAVLSGGASTAEAAAAVHVSLRTAERRLTAARRALGVHSTAEAVRLVIGRGR